MENEINKNKNQNIEDGLYKEGKKRFKLPKLNLKKQHWIGIISAIVISIISFILFETTEFFDKNLLYFILGISLVVAGLPFLATLLFEAREERNKEEMFLEFTRDLVENVRSGTSISKSIMNIRNKDYGSLNPYIEKLANQISLGIPVKNALDNFSNSVQSRVISRAITLIQEAERAGGKIETILESVATSVGQIEKLRKERKAAVYNLVVQGYIVFLIFIVIMLVMQFRIIPITSDLGTAGSMGIGGGDSSVLGGIGLGGGSSSGAVLTEADMARAFLYLLIVQGLFAGLVIGKVSEGSIKAGLKHSFILIALALLISLGANVFL